MTDYALSPCYLSSYLWDITLGFKAWQRSVAINSGSIVNLIANLEKN